MTERRNETLSAMLDAQEASTESLTDLVRNQESRDTFARYQLVGAVMRGEAQVGQAVDISAAIAAQVAQEPAMLAPKHGRLRRLQMQAWLRPVGQTAVAASVAIIAVLGAQQFMTVEEAVVPASTPSAGHQPVLQTMPVGGVMNPVSFNTMQSSSAQDTSRQRMQLQSFMVDHQFQLQWNLEAPVVEQDAEPENTESQPE
ncbi:MAG: hypothetical protein JJU10_12150 [Idiomarina sp.]|nr:hypothetical protein [Idiomarina sp.]